MKFPPFWDDWNSAEDAVSDEIPDALWRGYSAEAQEWADALNASLGDPVWVTI